MIGMRLLFPFPFFLFSFEVILKREKSLNWLPSSFPLSPFPPSILCHLVNNKRGRGGRRESRKREFHQNYLSLFLSTINKFPTPGTLQKKIICGKISLSDFDESFPPSNLVVVVAGTYQRRCGMGLMVKRELPPECRRRDRIKGKRATIETQTFVFLASFSGEASVASHPKNTSGHTSTPSSFWLHTWPNDSCTFCWNIDVSIRREMLLSHLHGPFLPLFSYLASSSSFDDLPAVVASSSSISLFFSLNACLIDLVLLERNAGEEWRWAEERFRKRATLSYKDIPPVLKRKSLGPRFSGFVTEERVLRKGARKKVFFVSPLFFWSSRAGKSLCFSAPENCFTAPLLFQDNFLCSPVLPVFLNCLLFWNGIRM